MITLINKLANIVAKQGRIPRRIVGILKKYCWIQTTGFWLFDLSRPDAPWRRFREQHSNAIRWELLTIENCRRWHENGVEGFTEWRRDLLIRLIEEKHIVLVGFANSSNDDDFKIPDCQATLALEHKLMTQKCAFSMKPDEGTIQTVYTRESARGRGLATQMYAELCCRAEERGLTKVYVDIGFSNIASRRAVERAGAVRMWEVVIYKLFFFKRVYCFGGGALKDRFRQP